MCSVATPASRLGGTALAGSRRGDRSRVLARARYGPRRRWWSDPWESDSGMEGWGLDGPLSPGSGSAAGGSLPSREQLTTFFCCDGSLVQLGPRPSLAQAEARSRRAGDALPLPDEQGLCIGSVFAISATNGVDAKRSLALRGFCFSAEQLHERVEDTVLARGGEVFETRRLLKSGVHEVLLMTVAIPLLWGGCGVPPEYERLKAGIKTGGGIIESVTRQWYIWQ